MTGTLHRLARAVKHRLTDLYERRIATLRGRAALTIPGQLAYRLVQRRRRSGGSGSCLGSSLIASSTIRAGSEAKIERMAFRLIQRAMRNCALLLFVAMAIAVAAPASSAAPVNTAVAAADVEQGCGASFGADCPLMCRQVPAGTRANHPIGSQPPSPCVDNVVSSIVPVIGWREAWSPIAADGVGPPAYLRFRRLLL